MRGGSAYVAPPVRNLRDALYYFALYTLPLCTVAIDLQEYTDAVVKAMALWGNEIAPEPVKRKARLPFLPHRARVRYRIGGKQYEDERTVQVFDDGSAECILQGRQCRLRPIADGLFEEIKSAA